MGIFSDIISKVAHFATGSSSAQAADAPSSVSQINVEEVLKDLAAKAGQPSNYQTSIVDLLKLLGLDNSLEARKKLADELHYNGDKNDSATMNVWLIKQVYKELAQNGGKLPSNWGH